MDQPEHNQTRYNPVTIHDEIKHKLVQYGVIAAVFALAILVIVPLVFPRAIAAFPDSPPKTDWNYLEGFISLITLSLLVGGGVFVFMEYRRKEIQQKRDSALASFNIYKDVFDRMTALDETAARRWIIRNIQPLDETKQTKEAWLTEFQDIVFNKPDGWIDEIPPGKMHLKRVLNMFDYLGFVSEHYWHMEEGIMEWLSPPCVKVWERIGPYVESEAIKRNEPDFYLSAWKFGEDCIEWREKNIKEKFKIVNNTV